MSWMNKDNLYVKFGREEAMKVPGGEYQGGDGRHVYEFVIPYTEVQSASKVILGSVANPGALGVVLPKGLFIDEVVAEAEVAFTSSGTIASSTLQIGLVKASDRTTDYDADGLTSTSYVGSAFDADGETTVFRAGSGTGYGSSIGTALTEDTIVSVMNSQHASHPYSDGRMRVRVIGHYPLATA